MMNLLLKLAVVMATVIVYSEATTIANRKTGPYTKKDDPNNVPADEYIDDGTVRAENPDSNDNFDMDGVDIDTSSMSASIFGTSFAHLRCFDIGYCECGQTTAVASVIPTNIPSATASGLDLSTGKCLIAPFVVAAANAGNKYHISYRFANVSAIQTHKDLDRITGDVTQNANIYRTKWVAKLALIISWEITIGAEENFFQAIIAAGETDAGAADTKILFLYEKIQSTPIVQGHVTGFNNGGAAGAREMARVCSQIGSGTVKAIAPAAELTANSNSKCGGPAVFVFSVQDASLACTDETAACDTEIKQNCNQTTVPGTCTESYYCHRDPQQPANAQLTVSLKWYKWSRLQALNSIAYIGEADGGSFLAPIRKQEFETVVPAGEAEDACGKDLANPDTEDSKDSYSIDIPVVTSHSSVCGIEIDVAEGSMTFAFKVYDDTRDTEFIDQQYDLIFYGKCFYDQLPLSVLQTNIFNDFSPPTVMPPRNRVLSLLTVDRPDGDGYQEISIIDIGHGYYLLLVYDAGVPFNVWVDPFGWYIEDCWASNNADFIDDPDSWERMEMIIEDGCAIAAADLEAVSVAKSFEADLDHIPYPPVEGNIWYQIAGPIYGAKWNTFDGIIPQNKIFFRCTAFPCTSDPEFEDCVDNCPLDKRKRKRRSVGNDANKETLYTSITIRNPEAEETADNTSCTTFTTTISTMTVLTALLLVTVVLCIFLMLKLSSARNKLKQRASEKKMPM